MTSEQLANINKAMDAARARGRVAIRSILDSDEMLNDEAAALMMDCPLPSFMTAYENGFVLGVEYDGRQFFPDWQFRYDGQPFEEIAEINTIFDRRFWEIYRFMKARHPALNRHTAIDVMRMSREPRLRPVAENWIEGGYA